MALIGKRGIGFQLSAQGSCPPLFPSHEATSVLGIRSRRIVARLTQLALNSLNQTVYSATGHRGDYVDDLSPGYVHHRSDLIWLDAELVTSRSNQCRAHESFPPRVPTVSRPRELLWGVSRSISVRGMGGTVSGLAAASPEIVERAVNDDLGRAISRGDPSGAAGAGRRPAAEQVELSCSGCIEPAARPRPAAAADTPLRDCREQLGWSLAARIFRDGKVRIRPVWCGIHMVELRIFGTRKCRQT